jgi:hypothetical protein
MKLDILKIRTTPIPLSRKGACGTHDSSVWIPQSFRETRFKNHEFTASCNKVRKPRILWGTHLHAAASFEIITPAFIKKKTGSHTDNEKSSEQYCACAKAI